MGLLIISNLIIEQKPDIVSAAFMWLAKECNAVHSGECTCDNQNSYFHIDGDGIPANYETFDITCTYLLNNVLMFHIGQPDDDNTNIR